MQKDATSHCVFYFVHPRDQRRWCDYVAFRLYHTKHLFYILPPRFLHHRKHNLFLRLRFSDVRYKNWVVRMKAVCKPVRIIPSQITQNELIRHSIGPTDNFIYQWRFLNDHDVVQTSWHAEECIPDPKCLVCYRIQCQIGLHLFSFVLSTPYGRKSLADPHVAINSSQ